MSDFYEYMGAGFDADRDDGPLEDDGWGHEYPPGSPLPEFDTREEERIDRL